MTFTCDESSQPLSGPEQITCLPTGDYHQQLYDDDEKEEEDDDDDDCDHGDDYDYDDDDYVHGDDDDDPRHRGMECTYTSLQASPMSSHNKSGDPRHPYHHHPHHPHHHNQERHHNHHNQVRDPLVRVIETHHGKQEF